jgi:chromosome segregation ATPase
MTKEDITRRISELEAERQKMNEARAEAEKALAVKQAEVSELTREVARLSWEGSPKDTELKNLNIAMAILER